MTPSQRPIPRPPPKRRAPWLAATLTALFFTLACGTYLHGTLRDAHIQRSATAFPSAEGLLTSAHLETTNRFARGLHVTYDFTVAGVPHSGDHYRYFPRGRAAQAEAARALEARIGQPIPVYYNPADPAISLLDPTPPTTRDLVPRCLFAAAIFLIPLGNFLVLIYRARRSPPVP